jgi:hypothetical protein
MGLVHLHDSAREIVGKAKVEAAAPAMVAAEDFLRKSRRPVSSGDVGSVDGGVIQLKLKVLNCGWLGRIYDSFSAFRSRFYLINFRLDRCIYADRAKTCKLNRGLAVQGRAEL